MKIYCVYNEWWDTHIDSMYVSKKKAKKRREELIKSQYPLGPDYVTVVERNVIE